MIKEGFESRIKIQNIIENQLPEFILDESPKTADFLRQYYISQEYQGGPVDIIENLDEYLKVDNLTPEVIVGFTSLTANISSVETTIPVTTTKGFPKKYGLLKIDEEIITYTGITTNTFTGCVRGFSGITDYKGGLDHQDLIFSDSNSTTHNESTPVQNLSSLFLQEFFKKIKYSLTPGLENSNFTPNLNVGNFIKEARSLYESKGTTESFRILFNVLFGEDPTIIDLEKFLIKPSSADYIRRKVVIADAISGNPLKLVGQTVRKNNDEKTSAAVSEVEVISRRGKTYYKILLFVGYDDSFPTITGDFNITGNTKNINLVSVGSSVITVDSTIGFPSSGKIYSEDNEITYTNKSINQFFGCSGVTTQIPIASVIRSDEIYYGYEDGDPTKKVELRFTGALSDYRLTSRTSPIRTGEKISIKSLGEIIENPTTRSKTYKEIFANSWIYNTSSRYKIDSFGVGEVSQFTLKDDIDKSSLKVGDYIDILDVNTQLILKSNLQVTGISGKEITIDDSFDFNESFDYSIRRRIKTATSNVVPLEFNSITSDVQNVYNENDEFMYVASNSLPSYQINKPIFSYNAYKPAGKDPETQAYSIIEFLLPVSFLTGTQVYYSFSQFPIPGLSQGVYYVEVLPNTGRTQIRLYSSKTAIESSNFLYFNSDEENPYVSKICDQEDESEDVFPPGTHNFTLVTQNKKIISPQKILRKFPLNVNIGDGKSDLTQTGPVGMLINGVEILSYKSNNNIFYGPLESIDILNNGTGYDVINPPLLSLSYGNALVQPVIRGSLEKIYVDPQEFDVDTVVSIAFTGGNGFGASLKPVIQKRRRELEFDARLLESSAGGVDIINETITFKSRHGLKDCEPIIYRPGNNPSIGIADFEGFNIETGKTLKSGSIYYAKVISDTTIQIHESLPDCKSGINTIGFNSVGTSGVQKFVTEPKATLKEIKVLNGGSNYENRKLRVLPGNVSSLNDTISFKNHGFKDGDLIVYEYETTGISGLSTSNQYYIVKIDDDTFRLSDAGIGGTYKSNYERGKIVNIESSGSGYQIFNYPPIKLTVEYTTSGIGSTDFRGNIVATPVVRGEIVDAFLYDGGSNYGSTIVNFHKRPRIIVKNGKEAQLKPVIIDGRIEDISIQYGGREYYSEPDIKVYGTGIGAILKPVLRNRRIVDVIIINKGAGYSKINTTLIVEPAGKNVIFNCNVRALEINNNFLYKDAIESFESNEIIRNSYNQLQYAISGYSEVVQDEFGDDGTAHSPIIGWAYDGNPIYGSYGYSNPSAVSSRKRMESGYSLNINNISNRPSLSEFEPGFFIDDYVFKNFGDLDECNGRFCVTPEFPNGVYAYFATSNAGQLSSPIGIFPYFIGNRYRSRYISENRFLNQEFDFNNSNLVRNTFPYKINEKYADNDFIVESNEIINQLTVVESVFSDSISGFEILDGGDNYKVGDMLKFDESKTKGGGLISQVSEVSSNKVNKIETSLIQYFDALFTWQDKQNINVKILPNHALNDLDYVNVSGFSSDLKYINGSYPIGVTSYSSLLLEEIDSYWDTGVITDIYVSGVPENISIGSSIFIRNETFEVLNVFDQNILRVNRYTPGYSNIDLISDVTLPEIPLGVSIGSTIAIENEVYLVIEIIEQDNILKVGNLTKGTSHSIGNIVRFIPDSFTIPRPSSYFESQENNLIYFNPKQSIGIGTSVGVGVGVTYKIGKNQETTIIPTQSIYLPNHPFKDKQKLILKKPPGTNSIFVGNNSSDVLFNGVFELLKDTTTEETVYVINKTSDYIGIVTQVGLTTNTNGLFFHSNGSNNFRYSFESDFEQVIGNVQKIQTTVFTDNEHNLENNDLINLKINPNISVGIGTSTPIRVKYDFLTEKLIINSISFPISAINSTTNQIRLLGHNLQTGQKVIHRYSFIGLKSTIYYIFKVDDNNIQLCETLKDSASDPPLVVGISSFLSWTAHQILPINPPVYPIKSNTLVFNLSDPSLFGYKFKLFYDENFYDEFVSTGTTNSFSISSVGTIGIGSTSLLSIKYNDILNYSLFYSLEKDGELKAYDKDVKDYSKITFIDSLYNGSYRVKPVGINSFTISLSETPEKYSYLKSECETLKYSTTSKTASGTVSKIRIISPGFNFKSLPLFEKINSEFGDGAYIIPQSNNIGKINQIRILNEGFEYASDKTLKPEASIARFLTIKNTNTIRSIKVIDGGKDYISAPDLIIVNSNTGEKIDSGILRCNLKLTSIFSVTIEELPKGLPEKIVNIIAVNNTNGVKIQKVTVLPSGNLQCTLVTPLSGFNKEPFAVGDKVFVEGIKKSGNSGDGFNSEDYGYKFFTVVGYLNGRTATARKLEFNLSEFTSNPGVPDNLQNLYANVVNYTKYPKFLVNQEFSDFIVGEILEVDYGFGFNSEDLKVAESNKNYIKVSGKFELDINYLVRGVESGSVATITKIKESKGYFEVDYASFQKIGWSDNIGILDEDIQVIADNDYYQNLSYSVKSNQEWKDIVSPVNNIVHPSGLKNFADTQITKNTDTGDFIGTDRTIAIYDITDEHRVDTINNFDLTVDVDIDVAKNHSKYLKFKNKKLTDYVECFSNRVLEIDDISSEFLTIFGDTSKRIIKKVDIIDPLKKYERYLIQASNTRSSEVQLTEIMILSDDYSEDIFTFERASITTGFSTDVGYEANSAGNFYGYIDEVGNSYLRFDPADPYNNSYNIKYLNTSFTNSTSGVGTTSIGFVKLLSNTDTVNSGQTLTLFQENKNKTESAFLQVHVIDNVTNEMNYAEVFMDHDGTNTNIVEVYSDTSEFFNSNPIGVFGSSLTGNNVDVYFTNTTSNSITVRSRNVGFGTTGTGLSGIGTYIFKSTNQPSGTEKTFRYESRHSVVSSASTVISFNSSEISSLKSTIKVSIGNTSALHQVILVSDVNNVYTSQYPFLSIGSTSGIGTFGGTINNSTVSLVFYPDSVFSGKTVEILSFNESFYSKSDYKNDPEILTYGNVIEEFNVTRYLAINDPDANKLNFELTHKNTPIFMKVFDPSDSGVLNLSDNTLYVPDHFFSTGEELIYRHGSSFENSSSSPISIASTLNSSGVVTTILPSTVYAIKIDNNHLRISTRKEYAISNPAIAVSFTSVGSGNAHELEMFEKTSKTIISIDNVIQSPLAYKSVSHTINNSGPIGLASTIFGLSGISSIFLGDILKIDDEYMKVINVGLGTTTSGPITNSGTIPLVKVRRGFVGSSSTEHSNSSLVKVYKGSYAIENNEIYFTEPPTGDESDEVFFDEDNLEEARSYFNGRVFLRKDYSTNVIFDDISPKFTGIGQTFTLTVGGANTVGLGNSGENGLVLINGIFQSPETEENGYNNYRIVEDSISPPRSSIVFTGIRNDLDELIIDESNVNSNELPRGGIIVSFGSTPGLGYAPLVGASVTASVSNGSIVSIGIGTSGSWGSGYRSPVSVEVYDPIHTGPDAVITASVGIGGTLSFNISNGGSGYGNPKIFISSPSYTNLPVTGVSRVSIGQTTLTGKGLLLNLQVGASSTTGIGSTLFSVTECEIVRNGYGFMPGDVIKPVGLVTGYGLSQPLEEFQITVLDTFTDSFSAWQFGQLDHIDNIKVYQNGTKKRFPLYYNAQLLSFHISSSNEDSRAIDLNQLLLIFVNGILQQPGVAYEFNGGSSFTFTEAPKIDDEVDIYFYRGSTGDSRLVDIVETIKDGDVVKVFSHNSYLGITTTQNSRVVTDITTSDKIETELYILQGIDAENYKPVSWTKQKADKIINGEIVSKARDSLEAQIYPTAKIIRSFSSTDNSIFVDDAQFFNYERPESINFDGLIVSGKADPVSAAVTAIVSPSGTVQSLVITNPGAGYTGSSIQLKISAPKSVGIGIGSTATAIATVSGLGSITTPITITNPGFGYSSSNPPQVIIALPDPVHETITEVTSVQGFAGKIIGIQTVPGIGVPLALRFTMDPFLAPFPGMKVGNPIYIFNTSVGEGVTSIINSNSNVVGVGTTFLNNIYHISALNFSPEENTLTCNIHSQSSIVGIATSGYHVADFSWGKLTGFNRSLSPIAIGLSGFTVDVGLSTFPTIQRRGYGLRNIGPIKKQGISHERDVIYRFIDDDSALSCLHSSPSGTIGIITTIPAGVIGIGGNFFVGQTINAYSEINDPEGISTNVSPLILSEYYGGVPSVSGIYYTWFANGNIIGYGESYIVTSNDVGKQISVRAFYVDGNGDIKVLTSTLSDPVINGPISITVSTTRRDYEEEYDCAPRVPPGPCPGTIVRSGLVATQNLAPLSISYAQYQNRYLIYPFGVYRACETYKYYKADAVPGFGDKSWIESGRRAIGGPIVNDHCPGSAMVCPACNGNNISSWEEYSTTYTFNF